MSDKPKVQRGDRSSGFARRQTPMCGIRLRRTPQIVAGARATVQSTEHSRTGGAQCGLAMTTAWLVLLAMLTPGCDLGDDSSQAENPASSGDTVRCEVERGPVKFTVELAPAKPRLSDQPKLTLTLRAQKGVRVDKPPFGEALGEFLIRDFHEPVPDGDGETETIRQVYTLEPTRAGKLSVAPIAVHFHDERPHGDGKQHTLESEALTIEVSTMLGDEAPTLADLRPLARPVELPADTRFAWYWVVPIVIALVVTRILMWRADRQRSLRQPQLSPTELAWLEMEQIVARKLADSNVKEFYVELTGVVRRYIERTTGVHAPEQTTEEFLREIVDDPVFEDSDQQRLRDFLESADLVKFAAFRPGASDVEASFERAREFIRLRRGVPREEAA